MIENDSSLLWYWHPIQEKVLLFSWLNLGYRIIINYVLLLFCVSVQQLFQKDLNIYHTSYFTNINLICHASCIISDFLKDNLILEFLIKLSMLVISIKEKIPNLKVKAEYITFKKNIVYIILTVILIIRKCRIIAINC